MTIAPVEESLIEQPFAKKAQPDDQHFCMVRTPSMGSSFLLVKYPTLDKVMMCTRICSSVSPVAYKVLIEPVGKPGEHLDHGGKLPRNFGDQYQFRLEPQEGSSKWYIYSDSNIDGPRTLIQTGIGSTGGQENQAIVVDEYSDVPWELFSFENAPTTK